ncbi:MAG: DeoR/GlpR family DNA-binding transcription regulator [Spirochaetaceae bacterium]|nr:DeoR/GlpR family DNA-binding transcription regulator [Spirochaetaceae bacterium]
MATDGLKIDVRRKKIIEMLARDGQVRVSQLSEVLGTTIVTIRTDLAALEKNGYCERIPGGAIQTVKNFYNMDFQLRKQENMEYKKSIAIAASNLVQDGEALFMNSGTTTYYTAIELKRHKNLSIVTNSISIAVELGSYPTFRVILLGGRINSQYEFSYGNDTIAQLKRYKADTVILSVDGFSYDAGMTTHHAEEAEINQLMMAHARRTVIVADYTKLGNESFFNFGAINNIDFCVTNDCADNQQLQKIEKAGVKIITK